MSSQSWSEFITGLIQSSTRVDKAAVFNSVGQPLAASEGLQVSDKDGRAIVHCIRDPAHTLTRITVDDTDFRCFQGNGDALVGMATGGSRRVLVARVTPLEEGAVVVVMGVATSKGSFLLEVQQYLMERTRRQRAPQGQLPAGEVSLEKATGAQQQQSRRQRELQGQLPAGEGSVEKAAGAQQQQQPQQPKMQRALQGQLPAGEGNLEKAAGAQQQQQRRRRRHPPMMKILSPSQTSRTSITPPNSDREYPPPSADPAPPCFNVSHGWR